MRALVFCCSKFNSLKFFMVDTRNDNQYNVNKYVKPLAY